MSLVEQVTQIRDLASQGLTNVEIASAVGVEIGDVATVLATGSMPSLARGGASAGSPVVRKFPFAFDTPNLLTGAALYTPTIGDILLDAWFEIGTAWNGTTPLGDVSQFLSGDYFLNPGWFSCVWQPIDMAQADTTATVNGGLLTSRAGSANPEPNPSLIAQGLLFAINDANPTRLTRLVPSKFATNDPVRVLVSTNGTEAGNDPVATQGAATLYLMTVTPA